jgi:hypothetical protein
MPLILNWLVDIWRVEGLDTLFLAGKTDLRDQNIFSAALRLCKAAMR